MSDEPVIPANVISNPSLQVELEKQKDEHAFQYAVSALEAQERDRKAHREYSLHCQKYAGRLLLVAGILITAVIIVAFYCNKEDFLLEALKYIIVGSGGGGIGYSIGIRRKSRSEGQE